MFHEFCNPPDSKWETSCCGAATPSATARTSWLKSWADMIRGREMGASATLTSGCRLLRVFFEHILCQRGNNNKCWVQSGTSSREVSTPSGSVRTTSGTRRPAQSEQQHPLRRRSYMIGLRRDRPWWLPRQVLGSPPALRQERPTDRSRHAHLAA